MREEEDGQQQMLAGAEQVTSASTEREPWRAAEGQGLDEKAGLDAAEDEQQQAPATGGSSLSAAAASPNRQAAPLQATSSLTTTGSTGLEGDLSPDSIQGGQSAPPDLSHSKSWLRRVQNRTEELRRLFGLPVTESLIDDFSCALKKRMLLQGRMYVFQEHACFHCNLFGYQKIKVIPLSEVTEVRKKKHLGFANSIEITIDGKREFFTSFLAREEAHRLLMAQWRLRSEHAPPAPEPAGAAAEAPGGGDADSSCATRGPSVKRLLRGMSSLMHREPSSTGSPTRRSTSGVQDSRNSIVFVRNQPLASTTGAGLGSLDEEAEHSISSGSGGGASQEGEQPPPDSIAPPATPTENVDGWGSPVRVLGGGAGERGAGAGRGGYGGGEGKGGAEGAPGGTGGCFTYEFQALTDADCQRVLDSEFGASAHNAPPVEEGMQKVLEFELACPPPDFWCRFLANQSDFFRHFHAARGDSAIRLFKWQRHFKVGMVRDLQFVTPVKARIGPPQAACHQTQRLQVFAKHHLVLETSQVMADIPYGDHFSVETRWDVETASSDSGSGSRVVVHMKVPFSKKTIWKSMIEKSTFDTTLEALTTWKQMAIDSLAATPAIGLSPGNSTELRTEAEWNALLRNVDPQFRGAVQHLRRHSRGGSSQVSPVSIPVGRQLPILARHRRNASRDGSGLLGRSPSYSSRLGSDSGRSPEMGPLMEVAPEMERQQSQAHPTLQHPLHQARQQMPQPAAGQGGGVLSALLQAPLTLMSCIGALLGWLLSLPGGVVSLIRSQGSHSALCAIGCIIIALQAALLLQQRQQLAQLQQHTAAESPFYLAAQGSSYQAVAAMRQEVASLQQGLRLVQAQGDSWRAQLDSVLATAADLAQRLQQQAAHAGR